MVSRVEVTKIPRQSVTTKDGNEAQPKSLRVTLDFDLTAGGTVTVGKLPDVVAGIAEAAREVIEDQKWDAKVSGTWEWVYGPWVSGRLRDAD